MERRHLFQDSCIPFHPQTFLDVTETFKQQKKKLVEDGFCPQAVQAPLYFLDSSKKTYIPLSQSVYDDVVSGKIRLWACHLWTREGMCIWVWINLQRSTLITVLLFLQGIPSRVYIWELMYFQKKLYFNLDLGGKHWKFFKSIVTFHSVLKCLFLMW